MVVVIGKINVIKFCGYGAMKRAAILKRWEPFTCTPMLLLGILVRFVQTFIKPVSSIKSDKTRHTQGRRFETTKRLDWK